MSCPRNSKIHRQRVTRFLRFCMDMLCREHVLGVDAVGLVERDLPVILPAGYFSLQQLAQLPDDVRFINGPFLYGDHDIASLVADGFHEVHVDQGFDDKIGVALPRGQAVGANQVDMGAGFDPLTCQYGLGGGRGGAYQVAGAGFCRVCRRPDLDAGALCLSPAQKPVPYPGCVPIR